MCYVFVHIHEKRLFPQLNYIKAKLSHCNEWYVSTLIKNPYPLSFLVLNKMSLVTGEFQLPR